MHLVRHMGRAPYESVAAPVSNNAADLVELNNVAALKLPYRIDSDAALLPDLIHQLGSAHEWSGVSTGPNLQQKTYSISPQLIVLRRIQTVASDKTERKVI